MQKKIPRFWRVCLPVVALALGACNSISSKSEQAVQIINAPPTQAEISVTPTGVTGFTSKAFHVSLTFPKTWQKVSGYDERYQGNDGFFSLSAKATETHASIQSVCEDEINHVLQPFGSNPSVQYLTIDNQEGCVILPSNDQNTTMENSAEILIRYPDSLTINNTPNSFLQIFVSKQYVSSFIPTIKFDLSGTP